MSITGVDESNAADYAMIADFLVSEHPLTSNSSAFMGGGIEGLHLRLSGVTSLTSAIISVRANTIVAPKKLIMERVENLGSSASARESVKRAIEAAFAASIPERDGKLHA